MRLRLRFARLRFGCVCVLCVLRFEVCVLVAFRVLRFGCVCVLIAFRAFWLRFSGLRFACFAFWLRFAFRAFGAFWLRLRLRLRFRVSVRQLRAFQRFAF